MPGRAWTRATMVSAALTATLLARPLRAQSTPGADANTAQTVQRDLQQLATRLLDESAKQDDRDEAAQRLVSRDSPEARALLASTLDSGNRNAQLAVARALAADPHPDPALIPSLFRLLGQDRPLTEAAAQALAMYRNNPDVANRLVNLALARQQRDPLRVAAIRALGSLADKNAASALVTLLTRGEENPTIVNAAAESLMDMTGLRSNGRDIQKWRQWWADNSGRSDEDFHLALLNNQASRFDQLLLRHRQLEDELGSLLSDQYQIAPDPQKPELLLRYLKSPEPAIRATGARLVFDDAINNRTIPPAAVDQLRSMIGDSSPDVRVAVTDALRAINDSASFTPLLTQLAQEPDETVRAHIARALAAAGDLRAVPALRKLLQDPAFAVAQAAADALRELAPKLRDADPATAKATAVELANLLEQRTREPGAQALRESLVLALSPLREESLLGTYYRLLRAGEGSAVRRAAVKALGELHQPESADAIVNLLDDPDATVRLEAVDALGKIGSFQHAETLYRHLSPAREADASVRSHAWRVLQGLFATASADQLAQWSERFTSDPERQLVVLESLAQRLEQDKREEELASTRKQIGETLVRLSRPADAIPYFRAALDFYTARDPHGMMAMSLTQQLLNSLLHSRQYPAAVAFSSKLLASDISQQQTVGPALRAEAQRLRDSGNLKDALALIAESRRISPALDPRYAQDLDEIETEIRRRLAENRATTGPSSSTRDLPLAAAELLA